MQIRKKWLVSILGLFLISLVSAQYYGGRFSFRGFLNSIDPSTITFGIFFIIIFALVYFALSKVFVNRHRGYSEPNVGISAVVSLGVSALVTYWTYRTYPNIQYLFYNLWYSSYFVGFVILIVIAIILYIITRLRKRH